MFERPGLLTLPQFLRDQMTDFDPEKPNFMWIELLEDEKFAEIIAHFIIKAFMEKSDHKELFKAYLHATIFQMLRNGFEKSEFILAIINLSRLPNHFIKDENLVLVFLIAINLADSANDNPLILSDYTKYFLLAYLIGNEIVNHAKQNKQERSEHFCKWVGRSSFIEDQLVVKFLLSCSEYKSEKELFSEIIYALIKTPLLQNYSDRLANTALCQSLKTVVEKNLPPEKAETKKQNNKFSWKNFLAKIGFSENRNDWKNILPKFQIIFLKLIQFNPCINVKDAVFNVAILMLFEEFPQDQADVQFRQKAYKNDELMLREMQQAWKKMKPEIQKEFKDQKTQGESKVSDEKDKKDKKNNYSSQVRNTSIFMLVPEGDSKAKKRFHPYARVSPRKGSSATTSN